ncbi:30S ribosomal protein S13 [Candidatus Falkowbacteria bacterium]|uniref:Small ribosomal subunit protein uS13 n=1 Tax=Candidatus Buchananbacteria bacterium CG10_big_fil_rev_8_21_14_0_10_33_19 TaxID=1974525 RepID=A0A2H0W3J4_9BACT|nr:30S ribosomal protein S13 [Candidatus Falkowbacteria bacterium]PIS05943.1 MAG: 30S ribosomal protein S13 [Candidatus Buchananbacteria bacterium CG10_big_fil_rev_8_21_14_0_10_33_19]
MAVRIAGTTLPNDKRVEIGLTYILGIGRTLSGNILKKAKVDPSIRIKDLTEDQANELRNIIEKQYTVEGELRREVMSNIKRLKEIKSYRGSRHSKNLPARGQRTKTNNRTVRGNVRKTSGSGRKDSGQKT